MNRAYYSSSISTFCTTPPREVLGDMVQRHGFALEERQRDAWLEQARLLQEVLVSSAGSIHLEFSIPRMGRRIDAVLLIGPVIFREGGLKES